MRQKIPPLNGTRRFVSDRLHILTQRHSCLETHQIIYRLPSDFVLRILSDFNTRHLDADQAAHALGIGASTRIAFAPQTLENEF